MSTNVIASYNTSTPSETTPRSEKLKAHVEHILGHDNIMFDCKLDLQENPSNGLLYHRYYLTCKLCEHVSYRGRISYHASDIGRSHNFYLCGGCYREWDPKANIVLKPVKGTRLSLAKKNGKLVLPCDKETVETLSSMTPKAIATESPKVETASSDSIEITPDTFRHVKLKVGQIVRIGNDFVEAVL